MKIIQWGLLSLFLGASALANTVREIPSPAPATSGESSLYAGADGTTYLTYAGPGATKDERGLWLATLAPNSDSWSTPRLIVSTNLLMENWADFASLIIGTDGQLWAQWYQIPATEDGHGYSGWFSRSSDGGATWSKPAPLGHEFVRLAGLSAGRVLAVWLESPQHSAAGASHEHATATTKNTHASSMRLKSRLLAPDGSTLQDWVVDPDVCTCCQTSLAHLGGDRVVLTYRGHTPDEIRDNRLAFFNQNIWGPSRALHSDGWKIAACPVNGPAAAAQGESLTLAWFTAADGHPRVQAKVSRDGGISCGPALAIDLGHPVGRIALAKLPDNSALISWLEGKSQGTEAGLYVRRIFPGGTLSAPQLVTATSAARSSGFARIAARTGLTAIISWTDTTSTTATQVRTAMIDGTALNTAPTSPE